MIYVHSNSPYPVVERRVPAFDRLRPPYLGIDFEWRIYDGTPTVIGVSDGTTTVSVPFDLGWQPFLSLVDRFRGQWTFVGHNLIQAERPLFERYGLHVPLDAIQDSIAWHYLTSAHLCKAGSKATGDDLDINVRGGGFMNIWTMCSIWTSLACWKYCRGEMCSGVPCPKHDAFWYNGIDALGPVLALKPMIQRAKLLGVDRLYPLHRALLEQFQIMNERGTWVNRDYIAKLRAKFLKKKEVLWGQEQKIPNEGSLPFNPRSGPQVQAYFKKLGYSLEDNQEETVRAAVGELYGLARTDAKYEIALCLMEQHLVYKEAGNGPDRWYADKVWNADARDGSGEWEGYVVDQGGGLGTIHPNVNYMTSTSRTACSNPNMQNIEKRRIDRETGEHVGELLREAVVAPPGYRLYSADYRNAENYNYLILAGYGEIPKGDLHTWMVGNMGIKETDEFSLRMGGAREASKTVTHATDYAEGLDLVSPERLRSKRLQAEVHAGARIVFDDWTFKGQKVSFTGSNLARRAWGSASWENRKAALMMMERYIGKNGAFPKIRELHRRIFKMIETQGATITPESYYLLSYDRRQEDRLKTACAMMGQSPVAHRLKLSLLNMEAHPALIPCVPVHDEQLFIADARHDPKDVKKWAEECMVFETPEIPKLRIPISCKVGDNWRQMTKIE